mmetsp:Transcript_20939/g.59345  ORF Transcript_20939/g.59345 Transcript_20939/m.59345 type:complete len:239 (+) Transcript_20939:55-771(+)
MSASLHPAQPWEEFCGGWTLAWCHERCFKTGEEDEHLRSAIERCALDAGADLKCFKKANVLEGWARRAREPYALLTDGREIKPCLQALGQQPCRRPFLTVVLQPNPKHAARTQEWAAGRPGLHILSDVPSLGALLRAALPRCWSPCLVLPPIISCARTWAGGDATRTPCGGDATRTRCGGDATRTPALVWMSPQGATALCVEEETQRALSFLGARVPAVDAVEMTRLLTEALPEVYED